MNKRYVLKNRKRFYVFVTLVIVVSSCIFFAATVNGADTKATFVSVTVERGDTLWDLAKEYNKNGDIRKYIHKIEKINNLTNSEIFEGDVIRLPA